ncbi:MAG: hypothetical protein JO202_15260 [Ktedonobacteraceae bacterium]|nr:hypothetical protein [Ktedonobacteraceae bacterium]
MQNATAIPTAFFHSDARNRLANQVINNYAAGHALMDVVIGAAGLLVPGGGVAAMLASLAAQAPVIYSPMVRSLARIYSATPDQFTRGIVTAATIVGAAVDIGDEVLAEALSSEFGQEFLLSILHEIWPELGVGTLLSFIPFAGGFIAAGLDATLAATLTWRVGITTILYFMNNEEWVGGSKANTLRQAKQIVGVMSPKTHNRVDLSSLANRVPEVKRKALTGIKQQINVLKRANSTISKSEIREILTSEGVDAALVDEALQTT